MTAKDLELAELEHRFWMQRELTLLWIETSKLPNAEARGKVSRLATNPLTAVRESAVDTGVNRRGKLWPSAVPVGDGAQPGDSSASPANVGTYHACAICGCSAGEHGPAHRFEVAA